MSGIQNSIVRCEIISDMTNGTMTAYLLSESSLFVDRNRYLHARRFSLRQDDPEDLRHHLAAGLPAEAPATC